MNDTRKQILSLGEFFITSKGFNAFSYQDIAGPLGIKKAAVHYYYPVKSDLGVEVLQTTCDRFRKAFKDLSDSNLSCKEQLDLFIKTYTERQGGGQICIVAATGADYPTLTGSMQAALQSIMQEILAWLTELLNKGKETGVFRFESNAEIKALMLVTNLASGLVLSRVLGNDKLEMIIDEIKRDLLV